MTTYPKEELEKRMIMQSQNWRDISTRVKAALISSKIILTKKENQKIIERAANQKYPDLHRALLLEKKKNREYFTRNVEIAMLSMSISEREDSSCEDWNDNRHEEGEDWNNGRHEEGEDWNNDRHEEGEDKIEFKLEQPDPLFVKGLALLKCKSGKDGYHGSIDNLIGLGKHCQGEILLIIDQIPIHNMKHFSLVVKPPSLIPEDVMFGK